MERLKHHAHTALRKSEKYFKTDMVYLAKGGFWLTVGQGTASLSSLILAIAFANLLPKEAYGTYKYILALAGILTLFTLPGLGQAATQAVAQGKFGELKHLLKEKLKWGFMAGLIGLSVALYYYINGNTLLAFSFLSIAFFLPLMESFGLYDSFLQGVKNFRLSTYYFTLSQIFAVASSLCALFLTKDIVILIAVYFISWTLARGFFLKKILNQNLTSSEFSPDVISYGKHLSVMNILGTIANYADRILLFHFTGAAEAAIYSIAIAIPEQAKGVFKNLSVLAFPKFSEKTLPEIKKTIYAKLLQAGGFTLFATMAYVIAAPYFFKIFFPQYLESVLYSQVFSLSLITILSGIPIAVLQAQKKTRELYIQSTTTPIVQLVLLVVLVPVYGIMGAITARILARFFILGLSIILLAKTGGNNTD